MAEEGSWFLPNEVHTYEKMFVDIWNGHHSDSHTFEFNAEIREIIEDVTRNSKVIKKYYQDVSFNYFSSKDLQNLINQSPFFYHHSFRNVRLLPHQQAVYRTILSRWPIIGLIADEVGLGKTIEAGATIKYAKKFCSVKRTALLLPSSLRYQWQREMYNLFGLKFYVYESGSKSLVFSPNNDPLDKINNVNQGDYFEHGVDNIIFSWHYMRMPLKNGEFRLTKNDGVDMAVVDEAHGARLSLNLDGETKSTYLYRYLNDFLSCVPHKLLLTATPYQTSSMDYLSLLQLLMGEDNIEQESLDRIALINSSQPLVNQQKIYAMIELINNIVYQSIGRSSNIDISNPPELLNAYNDEVYIKNHPTTIFTIRNTRDKLKKIGYTFPKINLDSEPIQLNKKQRKIFQLIINYIENILFSFESTVLGSQGLGLVKIVYHQRIVSSYKACYDTLSKRLLKLQTYIENGFIEGEVIGVAGDDDSNTDNIIIRERILLTESQISIAQTEIDYINEILTKINKNIILNDEIFDPKIEKALQLIESHLDAIQRVTFL